MTTLTLCPRSQVLRRHHVCVVNNYLSMYLRCQRLFQQDSTKSKIAKIGDIYGHVLCSFIFRETNQKYVTVNPTRIRHEDKCGSRIRIRILTSADSYITVKVLQKYLMQIVTHTKIFDANSYTHKNI